MLTVKVTVGGKGTKTHISTLVMPEVADRWRDKIRIRAIDRRKIECRGTDEVALIVQEVQRKYQYIMIQYTAEGSVIGMDAISVCKNYHPSF